MGSSGAETMRLNCGWPANSAENGCTVQVLRLQSIVLVVDRLRKKDLPTTGIKRPAGSYKDAFCVHIGAIGIHF